jgi:acyl-[acyl-carrier-protein]-phospholipid O-acyltransferase/long-chain-fatty-acid--[acyl-carrier-protein] ligase
MILHHEFVKTAKKYAKKPAILDRATQRDVPYSRALIGSLVLGRRFKKYTESCIGIMVPTSAGAFLSILGTLMAGKIPVMINYSTGAEENCRYAQKKCGFKTIITSRALLEKIGCPQLPSMICLEDIMNEISAAEKIVAALKSKVPAGLLIQSFPKSDIEDAVVILFTSGSEKEPKAVQLTHKNIGSNVSGAREAFKLTSEDRMMSILPLFHVFGHTVNFWLPMIMGMTAITYANPLDYKKIPFIIQKEKPTMIAGTPIFFAGYLRESKPGDFESLRLIVAGADKTPDWLREGYRSKHNKLLLEGYGATETSPVISANTLDTNRPGSIGKPFPGVQVKIVDIDSGEMLPAEKEGKVIVKGDLVMKGYYDDVEETSYRIRDGWYDTGDMGMIDADGYLWHRGRLKRFVKIGGEMVSLVKVESELEKILPSGADCCVVEVPDPMKGAKLTVALTAEIDEKATINKLREVLPGIAIPNRFVYFEELPKMGSGKLDFRTITTMVRERIKT